jgi:hypothetical protein
MILYFTRGAAAFDAEYQMQPHRQEAVVRITPEIVLSRVRANLPAATVPPDAVMVCAATDINPSYALSTVVQAFNPDRTSTIIDWFLTPCRIRAEANDTEFESEIFTKLVEVAKELKERGHNTSWRDFHWGIDGSGSQFAAVTDFTFKAQDAAGITALAMLGRTDREFNPRVTTRKFAKVPGINGTVLAWNKATRKEHLFFDKDIYEEAAQKAWLSPPEAAGGITIFGQRNGIPADHDELAMQICGEQLRSKTPAAQDRTTYTWQETYKHDLGDAVYMGYALAGYHGLTASGGWVDRTKEVEWEF